MQLVRDHLAARPNLRTANTNGSPCLFPGTRAGRHLHPNSIMDRLRSLGIDLLGTRNAALAISCGSRAARRSWSSVGLRARRGVE
jgi:hypothetical protein